MPAEQVWHFIRYFHYLALSVWIGGIISTVAVSVPAIRGSMASKPVAGQIIGRLLKRLNMIELMCFLFLLATAFSSLRFVHEQAKVWRLTTAIAAMGGLAFIYAYPLARCLDILKEKIPTLETLPRGHAERIGFDRLYSIQAALMTANLLLGLAVLYGSIGVFA